MSDPWSNEFPPSFDVGDPNAGHMHFDAAGSTWYAPDGVTPTMRYDAATGTITLTGTVSHATTADNATNATNSTNLLGGGTASGNTTIGGALIVGTPGGLNSWAVVGTDGSGADGFRLYKAGVNVIDLNIAATPIIVGAIIETATTGARVMLDGSGVTGPRSSILFFNGTNDPPSSMTRIYGFAGTDNGGATSPTLSLEAGAVAAPTGLNGAGIRLTAAGAVSGNALVEYGTQGAQNPGATHKFYGPVSILSGSVVTGAGLNVAGNVEIAGAVAAPIGVAHLEVKNGVGDFGSVGFAVQAITSQTANTIEVRDPSSNVLFLVAPSGQVRVGDATNGPFQIELNPGSIPTVYIQSKFSDPATINTGGLVYVKNGALWYRGSGGTLTQVAAS